MYLLLGTLHPSTIFSLLPFSGLSLHVISSERYFLTLQGSHDIVVHFLVFFILRIICLKFAKTWKQGHSCCRSHSQSCAQAWEYSFSIPCQKRQITFTIFLQIIVVFLFSNKLQKCLMVKQFVGHIFFSVVIIVWTSFLYYLNYSSQQHFSLTSFLFI